MDREHGLADGAGRYSELRQRKSTRTINRSSTEHSNSSSPVASFMTDHKETADLSRQAFFSHYEVLASRE